MARHFKENNSESSQYGVGQSAARQSAAPGATQVGGGEQAAPGAGAVARQRAVPGATQAYPAAQVAPNAAGAMSGHAAPGTTQARPMTRAEYEQRAARQASSAPQQQSGTQQSAAANLQQRTAMSSGAYDGTGYIGQDRRRGSARRSADGRGKKRGNVLSTLLIIVGVILLLVAGGMYGYSQWQYYQQSLVNQQLAAYATVSDDPAAAQGPQVDWAGLKAVNEDVVAWVQIPGSNVNFPVYQGDDNEYYLHTTAEGEYSVGGQVFLDYENTAPGLVDQQSLVYGHHLNDGSMFTFVDEMADQSTFDQYGTVWYVTETDTYELEPLFFYRTPATNSDARTMGWASADEFHSYLAGVLAEAAASSSDAAAAVQGVSKVLTLATCDYDNDYGRGNGRGLLVCALKSEVAAATGSAASASDAAADATSSADATSAADATGSADATSSADATASAAAQ